MKIYGRRENGLGSSPIFALTTGRKEKRNTRDLG